MRCPFCSNEDTQVKDSRPTEDNTAIRRRRVCDACGSRFTTFERIQLRDLVVMKSNGQKENFDRDKMYRSLSLALRKRNVDNEKIEKIVNAIVRKLENSGEAVSQRISDLSDGRIVVNHFAGGERVGPLDVFTEVTSGNAQMYNSADYYWVGQHPGWGFFAAVPFGMIATEINGWIRHGGGQELWDELGDEFGLKNFMAGNSGVQMGGWFNKEINSPDDFKGLKMRIPGLGGMMMSKLGLSVVGVPGGQIYENLINGTIDATEWVGPWNDERSRFYEAAKYYYWPGCHEPGTLITLGCNKSWLTSLSKTDQMIIEHASTVQNERMLTEYNANNGAALQRLVNDHGVELREFNEDVIDAMGEAANELYEDDDDDRGGSRPRALLPSLESLDTSLLSERLRAVRTGGEMV